MKEFNCDLHFYGLHSREGQEILLKTKRCKNYIKAVEVVFMEKNKKFEVVIEKDEDGVFVASVPALPGCHTQADSLKELKLNVREAIEAYLESFESEELPKTKFVKVETIEVAAH